MIFGGLSEKEVEDISKLLSSENIIHEKMIDDEMMESNSKSMSYDLRHLHSPNISTHVLAIKIPEEEFSKISHELSEKLLNYGITNKVPEEFNEQEFTEGPIPPASYVQSTNIRIIGKTFLLTTIIAAIIWLLDYLKN